MSWTIRRGSVAYEVIAGEEKRETVLMADATEVDRQTAGYWDSSTLTDGDTIIKVQWARATRSRPAP